MQVVSTAQLPHTAVLWASRPQGWMLTVLCKATFVLQPGTSPLAEAHEEISLSDEHWNDDPNRSLRVVSDVVPFKPRADVLLVGTAYAPSQAPVRSVTARILVGEVDKSIEVAQDRWFQGDGSLAEGQRFTRMPLVYERAGGGPDTTNPVGIRAGLADGMGRVRIPNLSWPGLVVRSATEFIEPVGFGPIAPSWPTRREKIGRTSLPERWYDAPLPESFDFRYFNAAPADQQTDFLSTGARLTLENLHPTVGRLTTNLASIQPFIQAEGRSGPPQAMRADTLWIDTDRGLCTVTFRAEIQVRAPDEKGEVKLWLERTPPSSVDSSPRPPRASLPDAEEGTATFDVTGKRTPMGEPIGPPPPPQKGRGLPFRAKTQEIPNNPLAESGIRNPSGSALPFLNLSASSVTPAPTPSAPGSPPATPPPVFFPPSGSASQTPPSPPRPAPASVPPVPPAFVPSKVVIPPTQAPGTGSSGGPAPWIRPAPLVIPLSPEPAPSPSVGHDPSAAQSGIASASDAAIKRSESSTSPEPSPSPAPKRRSPPSEVIDLLWFDAEAPALVRRQTAWAEYLRDQQRPVEWIVGEEPEEPTQAVTDKRDVRRALGRVPALDSAGIARSMDESVDEDGIFERPILVVGGELQMSYDPLETLKTTLVVASQLAATDKRLKEVLDSAEEVANGPKGAVGPLVDSALSRVKQAFSQANRSLAPDYLETTVQRILIEERNYLQRKLLGGPHIVGLLALGSSSAPLPTYLPLELSEKLPLYAKFRIRAIAEPHSQQDPSETEPIALRILALGRTMSAPGSRASRS